jgi:hypothetical protein
VFYLVKTTVNPHKWATILTIVGHKREIKESILFGCVRNYQNFVKQSNVFSVLFTYHETLQFESSDITAQSRSTIQALEDTRIERQTLNFGTTTMFCMKSDGSIKNHRTDSSTG